MPYILILASYLISNLYEPWSSFYQELLLIFGFLYLSIIINKIETNSVFIQTISLITIIAIISSSDNNIIYTAYLVLFFIAILISSNSASTKKILLTLMVASVVSSAFAMFQYFGLINTVWIINIESGSRVFANLGQPNNLATLLCIGIACTLYFYEKNTIGRIASSILTLFLLVGVVLTQSRTPWLACIAVLIFWTWKYYTIPNKPQLTPFVLLSWCMVFAVMTFTFPYFADLLLLKGQDLGSRAQAFERWELYTQFYHAILQGPIWGYGVGQVAAAQVAITPDYPVPIMTFYTHSILLDILIWFGPIIGGAIVVACGIWLFRLGLHAKSIESLFALVAAGFILTHSMLEYPHAYAYFLLPLGLFLGIAQTDIPNQKIIEVPRWAFQSFIGLLAVLGSWIAYEYITIEEDFRLLRFETANIGTVKADKLAPDVILLKSLSDYSRFARTPINENMTDVELEWMRKVAHNYPYAESLKKYIFALAINKKNTEAKQQLVVLKGLHKSDRYAETIAGLQFYAKEHPHIYKLLSLVDLSTH